MSGAVEGMAPTDAEFLSDLAGRLFRTATTAMGFDQGDTDRLHRIARDLTTPPARPYADGVAEERARIIKLARQNLALTQGCMECNAEDERRWADTIRWLEENA